jgi:hypothetical protein
MKKYYIITVIVAVICLILGLTAGIFVGIKRGIPFVTQREQWTIGIYSGESPFDFPESQQSWWNPMFKAEDVTDVPAKFVADPFLVKEDATWYLFFEVYNLDTKQGDLAVATSTDTKSWNYKQVILDEPFHLSYPYVFKWQDDYYLIPESFEANSMPLDPGLISNTCVVTSGEFPIFQSSSPFLSSLAVKNRVPLVLKN